MMLVGAALALTAGAQRASAQADTSAKADTTTHADTSTHLPSDTTWRATLTPAPGARSMPGARVGGINVGGMATLMPADVVRQMTARVYLSGLPAGSTHPWHIHMGTCDNDQGIVGKATSYTPLVIGRDGQGMVAVTLPIPVPTMGEYMVKVHRSAADMSVLACGNLARVGE